MSAAEADTIASEPQPLTSVVEVSSASPPVRQTHALLTREDFLQVRSIEYIFYVVVLTYFYVTLGYSLIVFCAKHVDALRNEGQRIDSPWSLFALFGSRGIDATDYQFNSLIESGSLILVLLFFLGCSYLLRRKGTICSFFCDSENRTPGAARRFFGVDTHAPKLLCVFHSVCGFVISLVIFGPKFLFGQFLMIVNYCVFSYLSRRVSYRVYATLTWGFHIATLFLVFQYNGFSFRWLGLESFDRPWRVIFGWQIHHRLSVLRMISFNLDMFEACHCTPEQTAKIITKHNTGCIECGRLRYQFKSLSMSSLALRCYKFRVERSRKEHEYTFLNYLGYIYYFPLFLSGPIMTFNAYLSYVEVPAQAITGGIKLCSYFFETCFSIFGAITLQHFFYCRAILNASSKNPFYDDSPNLLHRLSFGNQLFLFYMTLCIFWFKFNSIWKLARLVALVDGFDPPEDMRRYITASLTVQAFWRNWHVSFYQWIVRYMYIPLGGKQRRLFSIFPIFLFVALWHELELHLLHWALIGCFFILLETMIMFVFNHSKLWPFVELRKSKSVYRFVRAAGGAFMQVSLAIINLVGFSPAGLSFLTPFLLQLINPFYMLMVLFLAFCNNHLVIQHDDSELYQQQIEKDLFGVASHGA